MASVPARPWPGLWRALAITYDDWSSDRAARLAASLSFYTTLSLAPLLLVVISIGGALFGAEIVRGELMRQIATLTGPRGAEAIQSLLVDAVHEDQSLFASMVGLVTLVLGAAGVAWELKEALNTVWDVPPRRITTLAMIKSYFVSLALVLGVGFVLVVSLVVTAVLAAINQYLTSFLPGSDIFWMGVNATASLAALTLCFGLMFKLLPDAPVRLADVWVGALATAIFFELGKSVVGAYLGQVAIASAYGAAGSFVIVLLWVYYAAQIFFFGAEFAHVMAASQWVTKTAAAGPRVELMPRP